MPFKVSAKAGYFLVLFALQLFFSNHYLDGDMANSILDLSAAIVDEGRLEIDTYSRNSVDIAYYDGHYYSGKAPGLSILAIPLYAGARAVMALVPDSREQALDARIQGAASEEYAGRPSVRFTPHPARFILAHIGLNAITSLATCLTGWLLFEMARRVPPLRSRAPLLPVALAFGTVFFYWGNLVHTQPMATAWLIGAWYLLDFAERPANPAHRARLAGLALGVALAIDYSTLIGIGVFGVYLLWRRRWREGWWMAQGGLLPAALLCLYHAAAFGSPWSTPYHHLAFAPFAGPPLDGSEAFRLPQPGQLLGLLVGYPEGVLTTMPLLLLAGSGLARLYRQPAHRRVAAFSGAMGLAFVLSLVLARFESVSMGGVGPRYCMPGIPFLLLGLAMPYRPPAAWPAWLAAGLRVGENLLLAGSMAINLMAAFFGRMLIDSGPLIELVRRFGLTTYTLRELNQHGLLASPTVSTLVVLSAMLLAAWLLSRGRAALAAGGLRSP
jgi:hypothetical protein